MNREVNLGDIWKRRVELHDPYDRVRVVGRIDNAGERPDEWTVAPAEEFGGVVGTTAAGIIEHCDLVSSGEPDEDWATDVVA